MGWRGRGREGPWPGRGPFSYLPPWQRPGWLYGRGACWWLFAPYLRAVAPVVPPAEAPTTPIMPPQMSKEQEILVLKNQMKSLEQQLDQIRKRLKELSARE